MNKKKATAGQIVIIIVGVILYVILMMLVTSISRANGQLNGEIQGMIAQGAPVGEIMGKIAKNQNSFNGVITQVQVIISVILVLTNQKRGFITATILTFASMLSALIALISSIRAGGNLGALPGVITPIATFVIILIIYLNQSSLLRTHNELNDSYDRLIEQNHQIQMAEDQLKELAYGDRLTGMRNKAWLRNDLADKIEEGKSFALIEMDMDNFKQINDTFGHEIGDTLIKTYATRLEKFCVNKYTCAKTGGDEFAIILEGAITQADALNVVEQLRILFGEIANVNGNQFRITMSYGICGCPNDGQNPDSLLLAADTALYNAKMQGKDRPIVFSPQSLG